MHFQGYTRYILSSIYCLHKIHLFSTTESTFNCKMRPKFDIEYKKITAHRSRINFAPSYWMEVISECSRVKYEWMCHIIQWAWLCRAAGKFLQQFSFGSMHGPAVPPADHAEYFTFCMYSWRVQQPWWKEYIWYSKKCTPSVFFVLSGLHTQHRSKAGTHYQRNTEYARYC